MKHNSGNRRPRSRGNKSRNNNGGGGRNNYESNGPDGKVRGTAQQVLDKYLALARDAHSSGDRINAEAYFQFAEHYYRVLNADGGNANQPNRRDRQQGDAPAPAEEPAASPAEAQAAPDNEADAGPQAVDPAELPQPDIADVIPPAIAVGGDETPPKPRRRRTRAKTEEPAEETETAQAS